MEMKKFQKIFANQGYLLDCEAKPLEGGGFHASAVVTRYSDRHVASTMVFAPEIPFVSKAAAIEQARKWAVEWVKNNG
ncbi:MAG: hypothetical protein V4632_01865 [Pseudomonadota bacterium]